MIIESEYIKIEKYQVSQNERILDKEYFVEISKEVVSVIQCNIHYKVLDKWHKRSERLIK